MLYPSITDYRQAVKNLKIRTVNLTNLQSIRNDNVGPVGSAGKFATVFTVKDNQTQKKYALKCFIRENLERKERYEAISNFLKTINIKYFCAYEYYEQEFSVTPSGSTENLYPVVKMEWVEGESLGTYLKNQCHLNNQANLEKLFENWIELTRELYKLGIAHGDLKHDNMIVNSQGEIKLIDYDGMFVPILAGKLAIEEGSPNYQHPQRNQNIFDVRIDYFSFIIIAVSLRALYLKPNLFMKFSNGENIIFVADNFKNFKNSEQYIELNKLKDDVVDKLLIDLEKSIADINHIPDFFFNKKTVYINEETPQLFIINIDYKSKIDKGYGNLYDRIKDIVYWRLHFLQQEVKINNSVFYLIIEHNIYEQSAKQSINFTSISNINNNINIFVNSIKVSNFDKSINLIENSIIDFKNKFPQALKPVVINLITNKLLFDLSLVKKVLNIAQIYNIYISDTNYSYIIKFLNSENSQELDNDFYRAIYKSSSIMDQDLREFLENKHKIISNNDSAGFVLHSNDLITLKFIESILLSKFIQ